MINQPEEKVSPITVAVFVGMIVAAILVIFFFP